jgi:DNA-binding NtrC family response regulator
MTQPRILVVDDEQDFLETLVNRLIKRKFDASGVSNGWDALHMIKSRPFDVVVLDIKMPGGMDGIQVLQEIKKIQPGMEVLLLTGHGSLESSIEGVKLGAFDYLLKPVRIEDILKKLALIFEK